MGYGVANPDAYTNVPAEITADMGGSPENMAKGVILDVEWSRRTGRRSCRGGPSG